jgi:hypothetical protein
MALQGRRTNQIGRNAQGTCEEDLNDGLSGHGRLPTMMEVVRVGCTKQRNLLKAGVFVSK